jgi:hypothetical protein
MWLLMFDAFVSCVHVFFYVKSFCFHSTGSLGLVKFIFL